MAFVRAAVKGGQARCTVFNCVARAVEHRYRRGANTVVAGCTATGVAAIPQPFLNPELP
jgi:hypothetical protein